MMLSKVIAIQKSSLLKEKNYTFISGQKLAFFRERKGLTQEDLADSLRISRATMVTWEGKDRVKIKQEVLKLLEKVLNITAKDLTKDNSETKEGDLLDHPLVKSLKDQIDLQKEYIAVLKDEIRRLGGK